VKCTKKDGSRGAKKLIFFFLDFISLKGASNSFKHRLEGKRGRGRVEKNIWNCNFASH